MRVALTSVVVVVAGALAVFGAPVTTLAVLLLALVPRVGRLRAIGLVSGAALLVPPCAIVEYRWRVAELRARIDADGPEALSARDLAGIVLLDVGVAIGGIGAGFPEAAMETALLLVPDADGRRTFRSAFPGRDDRVRRVIDRGNRAGSFGPTTVAFGYQGGHARWRAALALDPATVTGRRDEDGLHLTAEVPCDYHPGVRVVLLELPGGPLVIDETLFDAAERRGWMFPYTASWRWTEP